MNEKKIKNWIFRKWKLIFEKKNLKNGKINEWNEIININIK